MSHQSGVFLGWSAANKHVGEALGHLRGELSGVNDFARLPRIVETLINQGGDVFTQARHLVNPSGCSLGLPGAPAFLVRPRSCVAQPAAAIRQPFPDYASTLRTVSGSMPVEGGRRYRSSVWIPAAPGHKRSYSRSVPLIPRSFQYPKQSLRPVACTGRRLGSNT